MSGAGVVQLHGRMDARDHVIIEVVKGTTWL
jgi:hypothetical protein